MLPQPQRLPDLRRPPRRGQLDADPHAHRQGRRPRRGRGARRRRRRLPHQAVLVPGAASPGSARCCAGSAGARAPVPADAGDLRIDPAARRVWRGDREVDAHRPPVRRARVPRPPRRPGRVQAGDPRRRVGVRLRRRPQHRRGLHPPAPRRDRRARSAATRSRPSAAPATGSPPTAAERDAAHDPVPDHRAGRRRCRRSLLVAVVGR